LRSPAAQKAKPSMTSEALQMLSVSCLRGEGRGVSD